jgi:hypothetical protein
MNLHPSRNITKILLSTTSRFVGEYQEANLLLTHAFPGGHGRTEVILGLTENPMSRNFFVLSLETPPYDRSKSIVVPDYTPTGDVICTYLSILFGKRFDNHGRLESDGLFFLPRISERWSPCNPSLSFNNHKPRPDLSIPLNFEEVRRIAPFLEENRVDPRSELFLRSAGRFYLHALQEAESQPEVAFLDLITCAEILANYFEYDQDDLLDDQIKQDLTRIAEKLDEGVAIARRIRGRLFQVRRKFTNTLLHLLSPYFFQQTEASQKFCALKKDDIATRIKAAYDLRSLYIHTGLDFGKWIMIRTACNEEVHIGTPVVDDHEFRDLLVKAPTFFGLERIMRFCLLRFMHLYGSPIDDRLAEEGLPSNGIAGNDE